MTDNHPLPTFIAMSSDRVHRPRTKELNEQTR